jgi:hypothetical protein
MSSVQLHSQIFFTLCTFMYRMLAYTQQGDVTLNYLIRVNYGYALCNKEMFIKYKVCDRGYVSKIA